MEAKFILSRRKAIEAYKQLTDLGVKVSYSYKTNREVGDVLQEMTDCYFSIHNTEEIGMIRDKSKISFFSQAWNRKEIEQIIHAGVNNFVIDNEADLGLLLEFIKKKNKKVNINLRMKFSEHRIGSGRYFVYGMPALKVNEIINSLRSNPNVEKIGVHIHRKSQNTSEWQIIEEIKDSLTPESLERINQINLGGGLPVKYKTYSSEIIPYILQKIQETKEFLAEKKIETFIEPGRFIAAPAVKLVTEIIQVYERIVVLNCSIYNCALDTAITNIRMLVEEELDENSDEGDFYLIKGNTPTRDDIFRYKVRLKDPKPGDRITFLNAGAYNYTTDFCGLKKLKTEIVDEF